MPEHTRRPSDPRKAAEAAFRKTPKPAETPPRQPVLPGVRETVTLRLDRAVLEHFQADGPGWQDRINQALLGIVGTAAAIPPEDLNASNDE
jgi:uncharacterized protein (DUF4415 family)